jgi:penicillin-binding protein A
MPQMASLIESDDQRRHRLTHRALPALAAFAAVSLAIGLIVGSSVDSGAERIAKDFGRAWQRGDFASMHRMLDAGARARYSPDALRRAYRAASATATSSALEVGSPEGEADGKVRLPVTARTRIFGMVRGTVLVPVEDEKVEWAPDLVFPGLGEGEELTRRTQPPRRASLRSRDGKVLASGPADARRSPLGEVAGSIAGRVEPAKGRAARQAVYARGFPRSWPVGQSGLELAFERELAGRPGGELIAGSRRVLARTAARRAATVRTTIDSRLQEAAVTALAGRFGGIAALDARTGEVRAAAGIAFSAPQPPGSTFKIVTTTAALEDKAVRLKTPFPVQTAATIDGVPLENANGESCGGSFRSSFAHSCNSVFAPLGVKVGAKRLVEVAERYGFNSPPSVPGEARSTIPPAREIDSPLDVGSTAIGQGKVLATPLRLASMAQVVGAGGMLREPTLRPGRRRRAIRVTPRQVARTLATLMVDVVGYGTGTSAAIPGVKVAGKTGTAELEDTRGPGVGAQSDPSNTDAWFTAFAPAERPSIAVAALFVRSGAGGETAAPAVRTVLATALEK